MLIRISPLRTLTQLVSTGSKFVKVPPSTFYAKGLELINRNRAPRGFTKLFCLNLTFGGHSSLCSKLWTAIGDNLHKNASPVHILWDLMLLKIYLSEHKNSSIYGDDEKKFRK